MTRSLDPSAKDARAAMLGAIRARLASSIADGAGHFTPAPATAAGPDAPGPPGDLVARFKTALEAVAGACTVVDSRAAAASHVASVLAACGAVHVAVSDAPLAKEIAGLAGAVPTALDAEALFAADAGITTAQWGIAETGTLVLAARAERHRFASLIPPVHVALLRATDLRATFGEVLAELHPAGGAALGHCVTFVTGPSRTADIELTLTIGVHGPTQLHVIVIADDERGHPA